MSSDGLPINGCGAWGTGAPVAAPAGARGAKAGKSERRTSNIERPTLNVERSTDIPVREIPIRRGQRQGYWQGTADLRRSATVPVANGKENTCCYIASPVRVRPPARLLAKLQDGGLGGRLRLNAVDGELDLERDAALAIAEVRKGRVIGIFDRNLFWNAGEGTRLSHADNREFTQRVMIWAAGLENDPEMTSRIGPMDAGDDPPKP